MGQKITVIHEILIRIQDCITIHTFEKIHMSVFALLMGNAAKHHVNVELTNRNAPLS